MSIVGVTIDYGPFGFLDRYDPGHICNGSGERIIRISLVDYQSFCLMWGPSGLMEKASVS